MAKLNFQCHMILQKSFLYADLVLKYFIFSSVEIIFLEIMLVFFFRILWCIKRSKEYSKSIVY